MILRIWRARLVAKRLDEYRRFEREQWLPMLRKQSGLLGVLFLREEEVLVAMITVWEDWGTLEAMRSSSSYRDVTRELSTSDLAKETSVEVLEVEGGDLRLEALAGILARTSA